MNISVVWVTKTSSKNIFLVQHKSGRNLQNTNKNNSCLFFTIKTNKHVKWCTNSYDRAKVHHHSCY